MTALTQLAIAATMFAAIAPAAAEALTEAKAREVIAPWYSLFNVATRGDVKQIQEQVLTADYESCSGYLPGECWGRDTGPPRSETKTWGPGGFSRCSRRRARNSLLLR